MDALDLFTVGIKGNRVYLSCDRDMLNDLLVATEALLRLGKIIKMKASVARVNQENEVRAEAPIRRTEVKAKAAAIFSVYKKHLNNGCNGDKAMARRAAAEEIGIRCVDVKMLLQLHNQFKKAAA